MRFFRLLCVLAMALCLTASVYAETQSVKVSGDLTMRGIFRENYDSGGAPNESLYAIGRVMDADQSWFMSVAELQVDADLTDNVSTVIRLVNQRDWNVASRAATFNHHDSQVPNGRGTYTAEQEEFDVMIDLAYVTLKDFIYSPLTVTIGRQDLWFGKGFIIGANQQNPGAATGNSPNMMVPGNLNAPEYTAINSFDSVKAVLDFDPWTFTGIYAKIYEDEIQANDDVDLWGINAGYKFDVYKAEAEAYWFWKADRSVHTFNGIKDNSNDVHTFGARGSFDPIDVMTIGLEGAYQGGQYVGSMDQINSMSRSAWAIDASVEWRYLVQRFSWKPKLGCEFIYYSGGKRIDSPDVAAGTYTGWDPMYRGKFDSAIREFVGRFYQTARYPAEWDQTISCADASFTNQYQVVFLGSIQPIESLTVKANYNLFWNQEKYDESVGKSGGMIGSELDIQANWDYTEDVSFGLLCGWFFPGRVYYDGCDRIATDLVGTVSVDF